MATTTTTTSQPNTRTLLPLHLHRTGSSSSSSSDLPPTSSPPRRRPRRSFSCSPSSGNTRLSPLLPRSATFRHSALPITRQQAQRLQPLQPHPESTLPPQSTAAPNAPALARILSASGVAGFVVGTLFEACLMGWLATLHVQGIDQHDPPLFAALLALFLFASWSGMFHIVLLHMDALVDMAPSVVHTSILYSHFIGGLALGLGLEYAILHRILLQRNLGLLLKTKMGFTLGVTSIVFGVGCVGLALLRTSYAPKAASRRGTHKALLEAETTP